LKKPDMAQAAEQLVAATGWLPPLLRTAPGEPPMAEPPHEAAEAEAEPKTEVMQAAE
jgi:ParB family chromosome partitioning protein